MKTLNNSTLIFLGIFEDNGIQIIIVRVKPNWNIWWSLEASGTSCSSINHCSGTATQCWLFLFGVNLKYHFTSIIVLSGTCFFSLSKGVFKKRVFGTLSIPPSFCVAYKVHLKFMTFLCRSEMRPRIKVSHGQVVLFGSISR